VVPRQVKFKPTKRTPLPELLVTVLIHIDVFYSQRLFVLIDDRSVLAERYWARNATIGEYCSVGHGCGKNSWGTPTCGCTFNSPVHTIRTCIRYKFCSIL
jgi:hypothetical protein